MHRSSASRPLTQGSGIQPRQIYSSLIDATIQPRQLYVGPGTDRITPQQSRLPHSTLEVRIAARKLKKPRRHGSATSSRSKASSPSSDIGNSSEDWLDNSCFDPPNDDLDPPAAAEISGEYLRKQASQSRQTRPLTSYMTGQLQIPILPRSRPTARDRNIQLLQYIEALENKDILCTLLVPNVWIIEDWNIHSPKVS